MLSLRLKEGRDDAVLERLHRLSKGERSAYVRRVLAGASPDLLDNALQESASLTSALDGMLDDWDEDE